MKNKSVAFIDGDLLSYKIGFVGQVDSVDVYDESDTFLGNYKNKTEAYDQLGDVEIRVEPKVEPKPWEQVRKIGRAMIKNIAKKAGAESFRIYIDGKGNFRETIATIKAYKGNRSAPKPYYYDKIRQWLKEEMKAIEILDMEADDAISIAMAYGYRKGLKYIGCTTDKDALGSVGWLFNWDKMKEPVYIDDIEAAKNFYVQMLSGDKIDNIQGCRQQGANGKSAKDVVKCTNKSDMTKIVLNAYVDKAKKSGYVVCEDGSELDPVSEFLENGRLLWMLRTREVELWHPLTHMDVSIEDWTLWTEEYRGEFDG